MAAAPFEAATNRFHKSFARGSGAESRRQQVARFRGRGRGFVWLLGLVLACAMASKPLASSSAAQEASEASEAREAREATWRPEVEEEEVSLLASPAAHKTQQRAAGPNRESPLIKLELRFPSNGQPVGPPRVSHHPAARRNSGQPASSKRPTLKEAQPAQEQVQAADPTKKQATDQEQHFDSQIATNKSEAQLDCDSGQMVLRLNFSEPFRGVVYPDHNRLSPCRFFGDGHLNYELRIPLQGCGSRQTSQRVFVNNVVVRFHRTLELEEDEVKTLICRYPAPADPSRLEQLSAHSAPGSGLFNRSSSTHQPQPQPQPQLEQESQFELLEPASIGHPNEAPNEQQAVLAGGLAIDTLSDNLVVGPGLHQHHLLQTGRPYSASGSQANRSAELVGPEEPSWWQAANQQLATSGSGRQQNQTQNQNQNNTLLGFLDRMSSVELLFLTSSLMFLLLLLLALCIGYCCYKRQAARETSRLTSAILNRGRAGAGFGSAQTAALSGLRCGPLNSGHRQRLLGSYTAGPNAARWVVPQQQQQQQHRHMPAAVHQPAPSSSSPESDQSARGLLPQVNKLAHYNAAFVGSQSQLKHPQTGTPHHDGRWHHATRKSSTPHSALGLRSAALYGLPACQLTVPSSMGAHQHKRSSHSRRHHHQHQHHHQDLQLDPRLEPTKSMMLDARSMGAHLDDPMHIYALGKPSLNLKPKHNHNHNNHTNYKRRQRRVAHLQQLACTSESEPDDLVDRQSTSCNQANQTPLAAVSAPASSKLVLKSIEDSFITNLTEIHSQEYKKRNSMQPLHISKWRSLKRDAESAANLTTEQPPTGLASNTDADSSQEQYQLHNNLRSLTEMDVVFSQPSDTFDDNVDNLLTTTTTTTPTTHPLEPQNPTQHTTANNFTHTQTSTGEPPSGSNDDSASPDQALDGKQVAPTVNSQMEVGQLPDLILSPEYEHSTTSKLELKSPSSPHNSVSYV